MRTSVFVLLFALAVAVIALGIFSSQGEVSAGPPIDPLDRAIAAQEAHTDRLMATPGVVGTAVGLNVNGQPVVKIYTESPGVHGIPTSLDGVPAVVEVTGKFIALAPPPTVASFTYTCSGLTCDFDGSTSTGRGKLLSSDWDFGDGTTGSGVTVTRTYAVAGTYQVALTVEYKTSGPDGETQSVTVSDGGGGATNNPPTASFSSSCTDLTCDFTDASVDSDGIVSAWSWDFGDGDASTAQHPTHAYGADGTYSVTLTVTDDGGATGTDSQSVSVSGASGTVDPTARFDRPVPIGVSTGHPDITAGTIGARVTNGTDVFALSNNHVYANSNNASLGDPVLQPGSFDGGTSPADDIGTLADFQPITFDGSDNTLDAAIAATSTANLGNATPSDGYGTPSSLTAAASIGMPVQKYGRTTSFTLDAVTEINVTVDVCYEVVLIFCTKAARFVDQIATGPMSAGGDSGSLIVTQAGNNPVALLFAGSETRTLGNPIDLVLTRFGVSIDGAPPGDALPTVSITNPGDGAVVQGGAVTVTAEASDNVGVTQVEFFVNGTSIGVDSDDSDGWSAVWDTTTFSNEDSDNTVMATATDTAAQTASDSVTVTVDNTDNLPSVSVTSPADGARVSGTVTITADAADDRGVGQVEFFVDGFSVGVDSTPPYSVSWDTTALADGGYTVTATVTDSAAQTISDSISVAVNNTSATTVSVDSVTYATTGPHLKTTVALVDDLGNPVSGASVEIFLINSTTGQLWIGTDGTTSDAGTVTWRLSNAPGGCYETLVTSVIADGLAWDFATPPNGFCK